MSTSESLGGTTLIVRAMKFAADKHRHQRRKDSKASPYINHPIDVAATLAIEGGVESPALLAAALMHDTIEDTQTTYDELRGEFGEQIADIVAEVTDAKFLSKHASKRLQVSRVKGASDAAKQIKIADKTCNLRDILGHPPSDWSFRRKQEYFDWAKEVVDSARGANAELERRFDTLYRRRLATKTRRTR